MVKTEAKKNKNIKMSEKYSKTGAIQVRIYSPNSIKIIFFQKRQKKF